jgi:hypothetical protein
MRLLLLFNNDLFSDRLSSLRYHQYVDPDISISRITGEKFENIVNVFVKQQIDLLAKHKAGVPYDSRYSILVIFRM